MSKYTTTTRRALEYCPACRFDEATYAQSKHKRNKTVPYEDLAPRVYKDEFTGIWMVHCPKCGMRIFWGRVGKTAVIKKYNAMPRTLTYMTPNGPVPWDRLERSDGQFKILTGMYPELDDLSRLVASIPRDGLIRLLKGTALKGPIQRQRRLRSIVCRFTKIGYAGRYTARWANKGLYWQWLNDGTRKPKPLDVEAVNASSLPESFHQEIADVRRELGA
jgi:hypothetical protein